MKILVVSNFFYPELTPRAFRTTELIKELVRRGNKVELIIPNKDIYHNNPLSLDGLNVIYGKTRIISIKDASTKNIKNISQGRGVKYHIRNLIKTVFHYFLPREIYQTYDRGITRELKRINYQPDIIISISHPLSIHLSVVLASISNSFLRRSVRIAEFSDPMFKGEYHKVFPLNWLFGNLFSFYFKFFVVPTKNAIPPFTFFKKESKIIVIPQGFDFTNIKTKKYSPCNVPTFAYAGRFYQKLRNPEFFFNYLITLKQDFEFKLFVPTEDNLILSLIEKYEKRISGKITVCGMLSREELIYELSSMDFLVNFDNENSLMVPSKLIDYSLANRPILSFNSLNFNKEVFDEFLSANYSAQLLISTEEFEIKRVVEKFLQLYEKRYECYEK